MTSRYGGWAGTLTILRCFVCVSFAPSERFAMAAPDPAFHRFGGCRLPGAFKETCGACI